MKKEIEREKRSQTTTKINVNICVLFANVCHTFNLILCPFIYLVWSINFINSFFAYLFGGPDLRKIFVCSFAFQNVSIRSDTFIRLLKRQTLQTRQIKWHWCWQTFSIPLRMKFISIAQHIHYPTYPIFKQNRTAIGGGSITANGNDSVQVDIVFSRI